MSLVGTPAVDCVHQRTGSGTVAADHHRLATKRKLDDFGPTYDDDDDDYADISELASVRMRKEEPNAVNSSSDTHSHAVKDSASHVDARVSDARSAPYACSSSPSLASSSSPASSYRAESTRSSSKLQFFVRIEGKTVVIQANPMDTVKSLHEHIRSMKGIPVFEQRLIYRGKQLQWEQSLADCSIQNDASLQLVGRMRSTEHPQAWQIINDLVSHIFRLCRGEFVHDAAKTIKGLMTSYMNMTPRTDNYCASEFFQILLSSSVPGVLVMLYISPIKGNKECADCSIRHFLNTCRTTVSKSLHSQCALVVLELCKLLGRFSYGDSLYNSCRSTLGSLVETTGLSHRSDNVRGSILIEDVLPFVSELANRFLRDLGLSMESPNNVGPLFSDVRDFTSFLLPLRASIMERVAYRGPIYVFGGICLDHPLYAEEIQTLHIIFTGLLQKMEQCLQRVEEYLSINDRAEDEIAYSAWSQYLAILKELNNISKLYQGAEENFWSILRVRKQALCLLIVRYAKRTDDHQWILEHKDVTNFESRRHLAMMMFPDVREDYEELHEMLIDRSQLLAESFEYIARAEPDALHGGLFMEFKNEEATGPGVLREWFVLVCQAIFDPQNALFVACPSDRRRFYPNPTSKVDPMHLEYFSFSGRVIALALMHRVQLGIVFDRSFFSQLAGRSISLEDIKDADPCLYSSCKQILEMDADFIDSDALGLTFVREVEELGYRKLVELCPGGKSLVVNSKNRKNYVDLLVQHRFVTSISEQLLHFARGFSDILSNSRLQKFFFQCLELEDFDRMLYGSENLISVEDWKAHTEYNGYKETDPQIFWFWEIVEGMTAEERKILLFFWTSVKYLPAEGFGGLPSRLHIYRTSEPRHLLPSSHTCFYRLCFPPYPSRAVMQDRLRIISQEHFGCSFGAW